MRIVFLCGCLEDGRDGVGDYTVVLGDALSCRGHEVALISINDPFCSTVDIGAFKKVSAENSGPRTLRLPQALPWHERGRILQEALDCFQADLLSLQFVPFAFDQYGLPRAFSRVLKALQFQAKKHAMFHELWIGRPRARPSKFHLLHFLQKRTIRQLLENYSPDILHTNLPDHVRSLESIGRKARPLPLFSNIPPVIESMQSEPNWKHRDFFHLALFSQFGSSAPLLDFVRGLQAELDRHEKTLKICFLGGSPKKAEACRAEFASGLPSKADYRVAGILDKSSLAMELGECDLGLSPVPRHAAGKSGSIAAFLSAGIPVALPVVSTDSEQQEFGFFSEVLSSACVTSPDLKAIEKARSSAAGALELISPGAIAAQFELDCS